MRSSGGVRRHSGKAAAAASTARFTSTASARGTCASVSPVAGLITSRHSRAEESVHWPLMKLVSRGVGGAATGVMAWPLLLLLRLMLNSFQLARLLTKNCRL